jgi:hypothetical protein
VTLVEVKMVVGADYPEGSVPEGRPQEGMYVSSRQPFSRAAIFPHGKPKPRIRVVSERAIRQVHELAKVASSGPSGMKCAVLFIVNRGDCSLFRPCHEACPLFAQVLKYAFEQGVMVLACDVAWKGSKCFFGKKLPVIFDGVSSQLDRDWLNDVIEAGDVAKNGQIPATWLPKSKFLCTKLSRKRKVKAVSAV